MEIVISILAGGLLLALFIRSIQDYYQFEFKWIQDVYLDKVLVVFYTKHLKNGDTIREHKIIYDKGRNKKRYSRNK